MRRLCTGRPLLPEAEELLAEETSAQKIAATIPERPEPKTR